MYKCDNCGYESPKYFGLCPKCKDGMGQEVKEDINNEYNITNGRVENNYRELIGIANTNVMEEIAPVSDNIEDMKCEKETQFKNFNSILSSCGGFVLSQVIAIGASAGTGKSTLATSIADKDSLYISSEESRNQVSLRVKRVNPGCQMDLLCTTSFDKICDAIRNTDKKFIIIDSLNSIEPGSSLQMQAKFATRITNLIKENNKICFMICQVTRNGEITGFSTILHVVDTVLHLERSEISKNIIATSSKNRFGEVGGIAVFQHKANGFEEIEVDHMEVKNEIGATYTETIFGHKIMTISVESLVTDSQAAYGLRNCNGYNRNRLTQILGILSYYGRINFNEKDVYLAISNGLWTDDVNIELAIANSILSSYYNKSIISKATGYIKLNGRIIDGFIDGEEINYIGDLIKRYR